MKICSVCTVSKELDEFDVRTSGKLCNFCKECRREKVKNHYRNNKAYYLAKNRKKKAGETLKLKQLKEKLSCTDCGLSFEGRAYLCDFHHLDASQKRGNIGTLRGLSPKIVLEELRKCIPLCANCHRIRHNS